MTFWHVTPIWLECTHASINCRSWKNWLTRSGYTARLGRTANLNVFYSEKHPVVTNCSQMPAHTAFLPGPWRCVSNPWLQPEQCPTNLAWSPQESFSRITKTLSRDGRNNEANEAHEKHLEGGSLAIQDLVVGSKQGSPPTEAAEAQAQWTYRQWSLLKAEHTLWCYQDTPNETMATRFQPLLRKHPSSISVNKRSFSVNPQYGTIHFFTWCFILHVRDYFHLGVAWLSFNWTCCKEMDHFIPILPSYTESL